MNSPMTPSAHHWERPRLLVAAGVFLSAYLLLFVGFFPNRQGALGHDYTYFLPFMVDGFIWYHTNGLFEVPWFTPSFCGGWVSYPNIQSTYYALPGLLVLWFDPLTAVRVHWAVFAAVGFCGTYLLMRGPFRTSRYAALVTAGLFLFNGYYTHRMIIGHLGHAAFMLIPAMAALLMRERALPGRIGHLQAATDVLLVGLMFAYMVHSGFGPMIVPGILALVGIGLLHTICFRWASRFWIRLSLSGLTGIALSISKLTAVSALLSHFSRSGYKLPGAGGIFDACLLAVRSVFVSPAWDTDRITVLSNVEWALARHEWEYSLTPVPLVVLAVGLWWLIVNARANGWRPNVTSGTLAPAMGLILILMTPVAVNTFHPEWNRVLKTIPLVKSASSMIRWYMLYIPIVAVATGVIFDRTPYFRSRSPLWAAIGLLAILGINLMTDREYYHRQPYNPVPMVSAWHRISDGDMKPGIERIGVLRDAHGYVIQNDLFIHRLSSLLCYEPMFGYRLEHLPIAPMRPGPALTQIGDAVNLKNPACYLWPDANQCRPGDHFSVGQREAANAFLQYTPFPFQMSPMQRKANIVNLLILIATGALLLERALSIVFGKRYSGND